MMPFAAGSSLENAPVQGGSGAPRKQVLRSRPALRSALLFAVSLSACVPSRAQVEGVVGDWKEPGGSVIRIAPCDTGVCARLVQVSPKAGGLLDIHNPDVARRSQPLCGLQIGYGFHLSDPAHASDGHLYDPKSGETYSGTMTSTGDRLKLRGYVWIKAFGRTEEWTRVSSVKDSCS